MSAQSSHGRTFESFYGIPPKRLRNFSKKTPVLKPGPAVPPEIRCPLPPPPPPTRHRSIVLRKQKNEWIIIYVSEHPSSGLAATKRLLENNPGSEGGAIVDSVFHVCGPNVSDQLSCLSVPLSVNTIFVIMRFFF